MNRIKVYFGKDWKFYLTTSRAWKIVIQIPFTYIGYKLMLFSRWMLKIGRERCSYCGEEQTIATGLHMHASKKGMRCGNSNQCYLKE